MTRLPPLPPGKMWIFTRQTRLESGNHQIDAFAMDGVPVRLALVNRIPGSMEDELTQHFVKSDESGNIEGDEK
jgi:hypothetical protein